MVAYLIERNVWYNNYGFHNKRTRRFVAGSGWIDKALDDSKDAAFDAITDELLKGILK